MKLAKVKGSKSASEAGLLLPPPKTRRNSPRSKAAKVPQNQDFDATAKDSMNQTKENQNSHITVFFTMHLPPPIFLLYYEKYQEIRE